MAEHHPMQSGNPSSPQARSTQAHAQAQKLDTMLTETARQVGETTAHYYDQGRQQLSAFEGYLEKHIRDKPLQSLAIGAGVGMVLALLLKR